jgi:hypothetical protein
MRYRLRTLFLAGMVTTAAMAASARFLESRWFGDLTGMGYWTMFFSREVAGIFIWLPMIFGAGDLYVAMTIPAAKPIRWYWVFCLGSYVISALLCYSALRFAQSARE